jgi:predicted transcriptional regulator
MAKTRTIEIDAATADTLKAQADARGVSVARLVAELVNHENVPLAVDSDEIAELDRRWAKVEAGGTAVSHDEVVRWLDTWGTPAYRPWQDR